MFQTPRSSHSSRSKGVLKEMMLYPDVGQRKMVQLKALERAHAKLNRNFNPFEFVELSRKSLQHVLNDLSLEISQKNKTEKRAGVVQNRF